MTRSPVWYARRLQAMSVDEVAGRLVDHGRQVAWVRSRVPVDREPTPAPHVRQVRRFATPLPDKARERVDPGAAAAVVAAADDLLAGHWSVLGVVRPDVVDPDWFLDPVTGRRAPQDQWCFSIDHRDEAVTGNVKSVWELSRHHHLTVLASAYWLTGHERYAAVVAAQLRSWWRANPFLSGIHWTSGIELGVRLISWVWIRRLLDGWSGAEDLFENDPAALRQLWWHQRYLAAFPSRGSSANNHAVAESCGALAAACAFPWFGESDRWRAEAAQRVALHLDHNTFPSGVNKELATDYHRFVTELALVAATEVTAARHPLPAGMGRVLTAAADVAAALLDGSGAPPRQGDGDEGRSLVLDDPEQPAWPLLLGAAAGVLDPLPWWPARPPSVIEVALGELGRLNVREERPAAAPTHFADAGITLLRSRPDSRPELWVRCDGGPHGFGSIAAHAHADALSVEVRYDGVEVLVDPGTYCYHGEPQWREYFRSTLAHNTLEIGGVSQSVSGGPFLWTSQAVTQQLRTQAAAGCLRWSARHLGYTRLDPGLVHERTVEVHETHRRVTLHDVVTGGAGLGARLAFHLGPDVVAVLRGSVADLTWSTGTRRGSARLVLPDALAWSAHRGETDPVLGWYSPRFGHRVPTTTLLGVGGLPLPSTLTTVLEASDG